MPFHISRVPQANERKQLTPLLGGVALAKQVTGWFVVTGWFKKLSQNV